MMPNDQQKSTVRTIVASVIFPDNLKYFGDFLTSLESQTDKNFDLLLLNDLCAENELKSFLKSYSGNFQILEAKSEYPVGIREEMITYLRDTAYDFVVFADTDDLCSKDRIALSIEELEKEDVDMVYNDITTVSESGEIIEERIWQGRTENLKIDLTFLLKNNVLGLGNTSLKRHLLKMDLQTDTSIPVFDWMFYLQLFAQNPELNCKFIKALTFYRQHGRNTLGLSSKYTLQRIEKLIDLKEKVYAFAKKSGIPNVESHIFALKSFRETILSDPEKLAGYLENLNESKGLFWFEEINTGI